MIIQTTGKETAVVAVILVSTFTFVAHMGRQISNLTFELLDAHEQLNRADKIREIDENLGK